MHKRNLIIQEPQALRWNRQSNELGQKNRCTRCFDGAVFYELQCDATDCIHCECDVTERTIYSIMSSSPLPATSCDYNRKPAIRRFWQSNHNGFVSAEPSCLHHKTFINDKWTNLHSIGEIARNSKDDNWWH